MHECGVGLEPPRHGGWQGRYARKHTVLVVWQLAEHHAKRGLVKILDVVRCNAHADGAAPVRDLGQLGAQVVQDVLGVARIAVGDVQQAQRRGAGIAGQGHHGAQLRQHQGGGHGPLGVGCVTVGK